MLSYNQGNPVEKEIDMGMVDKSHVNWLVRFKPNLDAETIIIDASGVEYNINGIEEVGRRNFLLLKCEQLKQG